MLELRLREIGTTLSDEDLPVLDPSTLAMDEHNVWHDSSIELQQGLDVLELSVDVLLCEPTEPHPTALQEAPQRK